MHFDIDCTHFIADFEVKDGEGRKVCDKNCIANIVKVRMIVILEYLVFFDNTKLSLLSFIVWIVVRRLSIIRRCLTLQVLSVPLKEEWINGAFTFTFFNTLSIHIMAAIEGPSLLRSISTILIELGIQLCRLKCWSDDTHVHCDMFVEGTKVDSLASQILARVAGSKVHVLEEGYKIFR